MIDFSNVGTPIENLVGNVPDYFLGDVCLRDVYAVAKTDLIPVAIVKDIATLDLREITGMAEEPFDEVATYFVMMIYVWCRTCCAHLRKQERRGTMRQYYPMDGMTKIH